MRSVKGRILCTEDDPDNRDLLFTLLSSDGYEVVCTANPENAVELARNERFDLYVMNNWLPHKTGIALTEEIRKFDTETPILFYSGAGYAWDLEKARHAGAQGYLVKPVTNDRLLSEIGRLIRSKRANVRQR